MLLLWAEGTIGAFNFPLRSKVKARDDITHKLIMCHLKIGKARPPDAFFF